MCSIFFKNESDYEQAFPVSEWMNGFMGNRSETNVLRNCSYIMEQEKKEWNFIIINNYII